MRAASCFIYLLLIFGIRLQGQVLSPQKTPFFTRQDSLRGSITPERVWWDLKKYHLSVTVNPKDSSITGSNTIFYQVLKEYSTLQIDLQNPMQISKIIQDKKKLEFTREGNVFFVKLQQPQVVGSQKSMQIFFSGKPQVAVRPPWDGGITWQKDRNGLDFIASSCQGLGASVWWPNKDHMYDEVESMDIRIHAPKGLVAVSNGRLQNVKKHQDGSKTYNWVVKNPINNYGVNINLGDYISFSEKYKGEKGMLDCTYFVLKGNLDKAKKQFKQVPKMLQAFEYWFGPYPFYEDSYKLVEVPYLGMEHQSSVTYGNGFENGYLGTDLSGTGLGLQFDYIIIHESGHEWFANNITNKDIADMWIHESFTMYSEGLFVDYHYGKTAGNTYLQGLRRNIHNDKPIIGQYDVNNEGSSDMYYKGANMLHMIRQVLNNDQKWRDLLRGLNRDFYHQTVTTQQIENYISTAVGINLTPVFDQYLRTITVPEFNYYFKDGKLYYSWINCVPAFDMPLKIRLNGEEKWIYATTKWASIDLQTSGTNLEVDANFYVSTKKTS